jgi:hypothetical protein
VSPESLEAYCSGFRRALDPWPLLPLPAKPELAWWQQLIENDLKGSVQGSALVTALQTAMPQLLMPQVVGISGSELYKAAVLRGDHPDNLELQGAAHQIGPMPHWQQPEALQLRIAPHPCGAMPVLETANWADFELLVRALAHRCEPVSLTDGMHAQAITGLIHWGLIRQCGRQSRASLIVLHQAPYGSVERDQVPGGLSAAAWLEASTMLRLEHELTHLATKRLLEEMRLNLLDELVADCMGMVLALGRFDARLFGRCLGVDEHDQPVPNGRWLNYTGELSDADTRAAIVLVMARAHELEASLQQQPALLEPAQAMVRLQWLCQQRLDVPISTAPANQH